MNCILIINGGNPMTKTNNSRRFKLIMPCDINLFKFYNNNNKSGF